MANDRGGLQPSARGGFQPSSRGDLQPTAEECNDLVFLAVLKDEVEYLIAQMEDTLATISTSTSALWRMIKNLEKAWIEFEAQ